MRRRLSHAFGISLATIILVAGMCSVALALAARPADGIGSDSLITIEKGDSAQKVAFDLSSKGLIRSALAFRVFAKLEGLSGALKAGTYRIEPKMSARQILEEISSGQQALSRITVPEGYTLTQIAGLLDRHGVVSRAAFLNAATSPELLSELGITAVSAEGYLFPDTYSFPLDYSAESIVRTMVKSFRERISSIPESAALSPERSVRSADNRVDCRTGIQGGR